ncbi:MAG: hypothetical protein HN833_02720 [Elusimicrobiaceae bacterium]|jgi:hypothetical protein|nr:hypothetical protein [Elusimicrobiaceae bacterium]MBT4402880.1 hypothetical protein [Elusimicrobiaceae bacterium]MBT4440114.1 hypothetical protein [Elusimicrobiaceae bacterium]MBT7283304.1 hypothetical protein [Elusimicrobiaceae bacterium]
MDIDKKLKGGYWFLILALLGVPAYQYFVMPQMEKATPVLEEKSDLQKLEAELLGRITAETAVFFDEADEETSTDAPPIVSTTDLAESQVDKLLKIRNDVELLLLSDKDKEVSTTASETKDFQFNEDKPKEKKWMALPPGFEIAKTLYFLIYRQSKPVTETLKEKFTYLRSALMNDLMPFATMRKNEKMLIVYFSNREDYTSYTNRPFWSGACSDLVRRTIYLIESPVVLPYALHEMSHIYFDSFFEPKASPLWLSEGVAVGAQQKEFPDETVWVKDTLETNHESFEKLDDLFATITLENFSNDEAKLWYTQSFSVVEYLKKTRTSNEFYNFCKYIKEGNQINQALFKAYGMPYFDISSLEYVWRHSLGNN